MKYGDYENFLRERIAKETPNPANVERAQAHFDAILTATQVCNVAVSDPTLASRMTAATVAFGVVMGIERAR